MKKHFKMYKAGKLWYTAAIVTAALGIFAASSQTAHADTTNNPVQTEQVASQNVALLSSRQAPATATTTNEVPQDTTTVNNQANTNQGWLDHYALTENNSGQAQLQASGWQVSGQSNADPYRWAIVYDNTQGHEVARQQLTPQTRTDVQRAYSDVNNSLHSGFNTTINIPNSVINDSLSLVTRYSSDAVHGEGNHVDYWFGPLVTDHSNRANLDSLTSNGRTLTVAGWHATNQATNRPYHYIIAFDKTAGHEIARQEVNSVSRPDVARAFPTIANAERSGFSVNFNLTQPFFNDQIQFISRWTDDPAGNGNAVDYWFNPITENNRAWLDGYTLSNGNLQVAGWHADDVSLLEPNHFLIVFDNTTGRQVASASVPLNASNDVARAYGDTMTANRARFNYNLGRLSLVSGHNYSLVSRYSATNQGNGNNGAHTDAWLNLGNFNQAASWVDSATVDHRNLTVSGWMANDQAMTKPYAYAIVLQNGHEIGRQALNLTERDDVARAYPQIYRSQYSGFTAHFTLPSDSLNNLQLVLRFTDDRAGNGNTADRWINLRQTTSAAQALQNAVNRKNQADQAVTDAQQQVDIAQTAVNSIGNHGAAVTEAANRVNNAQTQKNQADQQVNSAQNSVNNAQNKLNQDQQALDNANNTVPGNGDDSSENNTVPDIYKEMHRIDNRDRQAFQDAEDRHASRSEVEALLDKVSDDQLAYIKQFNNGPRRIISGSDKVPATHTFVPLSEGSYHSDPELRNTIIHIANNGTFTPSQTLNLTNYLLELVNPVREAKGLAPLTTNMNLINNSSEIVRNGITWQGFTVNYANGAREKYGFNNFNVTQNTIDRGTLRDLAEPTNDGQEDHYEVDGSYTGSFNLDTLHKAIYDLLKPQNNDGEDNPNGGDWKDNGDLFSNSDPNNNAVAFQYYRGFFYLIYGPAPAPSANTSALQSQVSADRTALQQAQNTLNSAKSAQTQANNALQQAQEAYRQLTNGAQDPATLRQNLANAQARLQQAQANQQAAARALQQAQAMVVTLSAQ